MLLQPNFMRSFAQLAIILMVAPVAVGADDAPRIAPEQLKAQLSQQGLHVLDMRIISDWKKSNRKIIGAVRADPHDVSAWAKKIPKDSLIVVYCA